MRESHKDGKLYSMCIHSFLYKQTPIIPAAKGQRIAVNLATVAVF